MTTESYTPEQWNTGSEEQITTTGMVASGETLAKYTPMGQVTASGEFVEWDPAANDGSEVAVRITPMAIDTTGGATNKALIKSGCFNEELVAWPVGATAAQKACAFVGTPISVQKLN